MLEADPRRGAQVARQTPQKSPDEFPAAVRGVDPRPDRLAAPAVALAAGAVSATSFPAGNFPALLLGTAALALLIDGADASPRQVRRAASAGWALFFGQCIWWAGTGSASPS